MRLTLPALAGILLLPMAALAQRTEDNAVRQAEDGFGFTVGNEEIGIYSIDSVRGFSPFDAGNLRLNGLYIDRRGDFPEALERGSTVKVGITAIRTPLLAPSGIGEITLKEIGAKPVTSLGVSTSSWGMLKLEGETRIGRRDGFSLVAAGRANFRSESGDGSDGHGWHFGLAPRWQIGKGSHVQAYIGRNQFSGFEYGPSYYTSGSFVPQRLPRRAKLQQDWNRNSGHALQAGLMADIALGGEWRARGGLFRSRGVDRAGTYEFTGEVDAAGFGVRQAILGQRYDVSAWSGEGQLIRGLSGKNWHGEILAAVRFRRVAERVGAGRFVTLDPAPVKLSDAPAVAEPARVVLPRDVSHVRQVQPGLALRGTWKDRIAVNLGIQKADYGKRVDFAAGGAARISSRPVLWNAGLAVSPTSTLTLYAGLAKGLEESGVAPDIAANARTALPAAITRQKDMGLSWKPGPGFNLIAGAFSIRRPYANIDTARVFRFLGALKNEGVELSVVAQPVEGLNLVAGALRQWPRLSGEEVALGLVGPVPVAFAEYTANGAVDYRIPGVPGLSANASVNVVGPRLARIDGSLRLPRRETVNFGLRYQFRKGATDWALSARIENLLNSYDWTVGGDGGFNYTAPRSLTVSLFADF